jgi:hypothetical protein
VAKSLGPWICRLFSRRWGTARAARSGAGRQKRQPVDPAPGAEGMADKLDELVEPADEPENAVLAWHPPPGRSATLEITSRGQPCHTRQRPAISHGHPHALHFGREQAPGLIADQGLDSATDHPS